LSIRRLSCRSVPRDKETAEAFDFLIILAPAFHFCRFQSLFVLFITVASVPGFSAALGIQGFPPNLMSVPRPAMLVAMVTEPLAPASAMIRASLW
jgi:type III secretory pathway component EscR